MLLINFTFAQFYFLIASSQIIENDAILINYGSFYFYYDEPTHVPNYKKKIHGTGSMGLLNHVEILINFIVKNGLPLPQYIVYPDSNLKKIIFHS